MLYAVAFALIGLQAMLVADPRGFSTPDACMVRAIEMQTIVPLYLHARGVPPGVEIKVDIKCVTKSELDTLMGTEQGA